MTATSADAALISRHRGRVSVDLQSLIGGARTWPAFARLSRCANCRRVSLAPDVPTIAETLPGFEAVAWFGVVAPPKTPRNIVDKINADVNEALSQPALQDLLEKLSAETFGGSIEKTSNACGTRSTDGMPWSKQQILRASDEANESEHRLWVSLIQVSSFQPLLCECPSKG